MNKETLHDILSSDNAQHNEQIEQLKRNKIDKTTVFLGTATCGLSAGANKVLPILEEYTKANNIELVKVGCIGLCAEEPIMDVQVPGKTRISFKNVDTKNVVEIIESVLNNSIKKKNVPVYMLSSLGDSLHGSIDTVSLGLSGVFQKPLRPDILITTIKDKI